MPDYDFLASLVERVNRSRARLVDVDFDDVDPREVATLAMIAQTGHRQTSEARDDV